MKREKVGRALLGMAIAFLAGVALTYMALARGGKQVPDSSGETDVHTSEAGRQRESNSIRLESVVKDPRQAIASTEVAPKPQELMPPEKSAEAPGVRLDGAEPFSNATRVMLDPAFNPLKKSLTTEQRHELQAIIDEANRKASELKLAIDAQVEEHAHLMVSRGEGAPLPRGQKARMTSPDHDTLSVINEGSGAFSVSFSKRSVPGIAASMDARAEQVQRATDAIKDFFAQR